MEEEVLCQQKCVITSLANNVEIFVSFLYAGSARPKPGVYVLNIIRKTKSLNPVIRLEPKKPASNQYLPLWCVSCRKDSKNENSARIQRYLRKLCWGISNQNNSEKWKECYKVWVVSSGNRVLGIAVPLSSVLHCNLLVEWQSHACCFTAIVCSWEIFKKLNTVMKVP